MANDDDYDKVLADERLRAQARDQISREKERSRVLRSLIAGTILTALVAIVAWIWLGFPTNAGEGTKAFLSKSGLEDLMHPHIKSQ